MKVYALEVCTEIDEKEQHSTIKKMEVVFEEVFENANDLPPDPNAREEKFPIPWYLRIFIEGGRERRDRRSLGHTCHY